MLKFLSGLWSGTSEPDPDQEWIALDYPDEGEKAQVSSELEILKRRNTSSARTILFDQVVQQLNQREIPETPLSPDLRFRLFSDILHRLSLGWLKRLEHMAPGISSVWYPTQYEKGILGQILSMADRAAPSILNPGDLTQVFRAVHLCLIQAIFTQRGIYPNQEEMEELLYLITSTMISPMIDLWIATATQVKGSLEKQGRLPSKWGAEKRIEEERLKEIKRVGVSAKYSDKSPDPIPISHEEIKKRRGLLEKHLQPKKEVIKERADPENFREAKKMLEVFFGKS